MAAQKDPAGILSDRAGDRSGEPLSPSASRWVIRWGLGGVCLLLVQALYRLAPIAFDAVTAGLTGLQWSVLLAWCAFSAYAEGHRGFHKRFSPRVVARAFHLARHPSPGHVVLAPAFCLSLFHATGRSLLRSWGLIGGISLLVAFVRGIPQPWRGIIDAGVCLGLAWGLVSVVIVWARAAKHGGPLPTDLPPPPFYQA